MILMMPSDDPVMTVSVSYFTRASTEPGCPARPCNFRTAHALLGTCQQSFKQKRRVLKWSRTMPQLGLS